MGGDCLNTGCVPSKALIRSARFLAQARRVGELGLRPATTDADFAEVMARVQRVVQALADQPLPGWDLHLVTPHRRQLYSGMLPGWIAGRHPRSAGAIALAARADRAAAAFHPTLGVGLDPARQALHGADGSALHYDVPSIDTGPAPPDMPGAAENALRVRPVERFVAAWPALVDRMLARCRRFDLLIVDGGAAGVELAFAIRHRACTDGWSHLRLALAGAEALPLPGAPLRLRHRAAALLAQRGVPWLGGRRAARIEPGHVAFDDGQTLAFDACSPPARPRPSGRVPAAWPPTSVASSAWARRCRACPIRRCSPPGTSPRCITRAPSRACSRCAPGPCWRTTCAHSPILSSEVRSCGLTP